MKNRKHLEIVIRIVFRIFLIPLVLDLFLLRIEGLSFFNEYDEIINELIFSDFLSPYKFWGAGIYLLILLGLFILRIYMKFLEENENSDYSSFGEYLKVTHTRKILMGLVFFVLIMPGSLILLYGIRTPSVKPVPPELWSAEMKDLVLFLLLQQALFSILFILIEIYKLLKGDPPGSKYPYCIYKQLADFKIVNILSCEKIWLENELQKVLLNANLTSEEIMCIGVKKGINFIELSFSNGVFCQRSYLRKNEIMIELSEKKEAINDFVYFVRNQL